MDLKELIEQAKRIIVSVDTAGGVAGPYAQACEFLRVYAGPKSAFLQTLELYDPRRTSQLHVAGATRSTLESFIEYIEAGLHEGISPERRAQIDVVSDLLEQARVLLESKDVHPAAPTVLIGATLEEFLRTWVEAAGLSIGTRKPGLEAYAQVLRETDLITKQDAKDITSWGGIRNLAAHGEWQEVADKQRIALMLEGVNLFLRKYGEKNSS